jgi:hypothetical protein
VGLKKKMFLSTRHLFQLKEKGKNPGILNALQIERLIATNNTVV